jgi:hypothetical protein
MSFSTYITYMIGSKLGAQASGFRLAFREEKGHANRAEPVERAGWLGRA